MRSLCSNRRSRVCMGCSSFTSVWNAYVFIIWEMQGVIMVSRQPHLFLNNNKGVLWFLQQLLDGSCLLQQSKIIFDTRNVGQGMGLKWNVGPSMSKTAFIMVARTGLEDDVYIDSVLQSEYYKHSPKDQVHTFIPSSKMLSLMNLKEGRNRITFTFFTRVLGRQQVRKNIN